MQSFDKGVSEGMETSFSFTKMLAENDEHAFAIVFDLKLVNVKKLFNLTIKAIGHFRVTESIQPEFFDSPFMTVNAPAIGFPYLRAFLSNFMLSAGYDPIMLPSYNFTKFAKAEDEPGVVVKDKPKVPRVSVKGHK